MKTLVRSLLTLAVVALLAGPLSADDENKAEQKKKPRANRANAAARAVSFPKGVEATKEQQAKLKELKAEFGPKLAELNKKTAGIITAEQRQARNEAGKKARAEGKKGKELRAAVDAAATINDEQKTQLAEVAKERRALQQQIRQAVLGLLTEEQRASLPKRGAQKAAGDAAKKPNAEARKAAAEKRKAAAAAKKPETEKKKATGEAKKAEAAKRKAEAAKKKAEK